MDDLPEKLRALYVAVQAAANKIESLRQQLADMQMQLDASCNAEELRQVRQQLAECERERDVFKQCDRTSYDALATVTKQRDELVEALKQFAECDLNDDNCASLEVATRRIRSLAQAAIAKLGADKMGEGS